MVMKSALKQLQSSFATERVRLQVFEKSAPMHELHVGLAQRENLVLPGILFCHWNQEIGVAHLPLTILLRVVYDRAGDA